MSAFLLGAGCFLLLVFFIVFVGRRATPRAADEHDANLGWYALRAAEIARSGDTDLVAEARLRLIEDGGLDASDVKKKEGGPRADSPGSSFAWIALAVVVVCCAGALYLETGAIEDVLIYRELGAITPEDGDEARLALLRRIEARSKARPDNLQYLSLLGRLYMAAEDFPAAANAFENLAERAPEDAQTLAMAAQARFLAADREFDETSQLYAERALAIDPAQRTALGLLGMASFERGTYVAAISYWERLRNLEPSDSPGYQMLSDVIAVARERSGLESTGTPVGGTEPSTGIKVSLRLDDVEAVDPAAVVFVFARAAGSSGGMPIAVRRMSAADLPADFRLTDGDSMAGQILSESGSVVVSAQLSANGQPGEANALLMGRSEPISAADPGAEVSILLSAPR